MNVREALNSFCRLRTWRPATKPAFLLTVLFVLGLSLQYFNTYLEEDTIGSLTWVFCALCSASVFVFVVSLCLKLPCVGYFFLPFTALLSFSIFFMYEIFGERFTYNLVGNILDASTAEIAPFLNFYDIAAAVALVPAGIALVYLAKRFYGKGVLWRHLGAIGLVGLALLGGAEFLGRFPGPFNHRPGGPRLTRAAAWPVSDMAYAYERFHDFLELDCDLYGKIMRLPSLADAASSCGLQKNDVLTIVLHIGEGLRADHLPFNGYHRNTTPGLLLHKDNIVSFPGTQAYGPTTRVSLVGLLTDAEIRNRRPGHRPFVDLLKKHGFSTFSIIEYGDDFNRFNKSLHDYPLPVLLSACHKTFRFSYNTGKNHRFEPSVARTSLILKSPLKRTFVFLYDSGLHMFFESLPKNKRWLPDNLAGRNILEDIPRLNNAYDNCILEVDWEISSIIEHLRHRPAVYVYAADHGISLGENNRFGNNNTSKEVFSPAFFIWMSPPFIEKYPEKAAALRANADKPVSHDYVIHTVLSIAGIDSPVIKPELDLAGPVAKPFKPVENRASLMEPPKP